MHDTIVFSSPDAGAPRFKTLLKPARIQDDRAESGDASRLTTVASSNTQLIRSYEMATVTAFAELHSQSSENLLVKQMINRCHARSMTPRPDISSPGHCAREGQTDLGTQPHLKGGNSPSARLAQHSAPNLRKTRSFWNSITDLARW